MEIDQELTELVAELAAAHPRYPRVTLERLVARTARQVRLTRAGGPTELVELVRRTAERQLTYLDQTPAHQPMQGVRRARSVQQIPTSRASGE
jgi:hypothetical protein